LFNRFLRILSLLLLAPIQTFAQGDSTAFAEASADSIIVSPNPTSGQITASIELREPVQCNISVFDIVGTLVKRIELNGESVYSVPIDLTGHQSGMYVIYLEVKTLNKGARVILR